MKKQIYITIIFLGLIGCNSTAIQKASPIEKSLEKKDTKKLMIDLDKELKLTKERETLRSSKNEIIEGSIFLNDNDEVSFKGDILDEYSPVTIKIGDNDEISFSGNKYIIKTTELRNGDLIEMKNKNGKIFLEMEVIE
ncbi:MAG TPA: hypothetical protein EYG94_02430 [Campylobacterales bacterium]|nr:hypothetical protein [Campylobacterales bacterium]